MLSYDPKEKAAFNDPVVRCDSCQKLNFRETIRKNGCCTGCGNRRLRNVLVIQPAEMVMLKEYAVDPAFLALFEAVEEATPGTSNPDMLPPQGGANA